MKRHFEREGKFLFFVLALPVLILIVALFLVTAFRFFHSSTVYHDEFPTNHSLHSWNEAVLPHR